ncbi:MAG: hypothetical protein V1818_02730 [Candidatus Aenigmatarchaeota archaeon]
MKFQKEFYYCFAGVIALLLVYLLFSFTLNLKLQLLFSFLSIITGSVMVVLGFWGSDFAFAIALKQLDQSRARGKFKGKKRMVFVPFMGNYTPLEWWNINWFVTLMGVFLVVLGSLVLGIMVGVYVF